MNHRTVVVQHKSLPSFLSNRQHPFKMAIIDLSRLSCSFRYNYHHHLIAVLLLVNVVHAALPTTPLAFNLFSRPIPAKCPSPPCICHIDDFGRSHVVCDSGINTIPIDKMDPETQVINISAPNDAHNHLHLGRVFYRLTKLQEVHITRSNLPAIGQSTFCSNCFSAHCQSTLKILNLSQNKMKVLQSSDFNCLDSLFKLDLSDNRLSNIPSAAFQMLHNLTHLSLARNQITKLGPMMFFQLESLTELDLSGNPLNEITYDVMKDVPNLERLVLTGCALTNIDGTAFSSLSKLHYLDLSSNKLKTFHPYAFRLLGNLRTLNLPRNSITQFPNYIFSGLKLDILDLSNNLINPLTSCTFCDVTSIKALNMSQNKFTSFFADLLKPLANSLESLTLNRIQNLIDPPSSVVALLQPLNRLKHLSIVDSGLDEKLPESAFDNLGSLISLNLSHNSFHELSGRLVSPLSFLKTLDMSYNQLPFIDPSAFQSLSKMKYLSHIYFHHNPFSCYRCHILPFMDWLNTDPAPYWSVCGKLTDDPAQLAYCAQCSIPNSLTGRYLHEADLEEDLEWCTNPEVQFRLTTSEPQVGFILASLIILCLLTIITVVIVVYRKHGAVYYTQEDKHFADSNGSIGAGPVSYAGVVGPNGNIGNCSRSWVNQSMGPNRMVSLSSSQLSPQSSLEQQQQQQQTHNSMVLSPPPPSSAASSQQQQSHNHNPSGICDICANLTAVKQVIASLPAMTEMLENSLMKSTPHNGFNNHNSKSLDSSNVTRTIVNNNSNNNNGYISPKVSNLVRNHSISTPSRANNSHNFSSPIVPLPPPSPMYATIPDKRKGGSKGQSNPPVPAKKPTLLGSPDKKLTIPIQVHQELEQTANLNHNGNTSNGGAAIEDIRIFI